MRSFWRQKVPNAGVFEVHFEVPYRRTCGVASSSNRTWGNGGGRDASGDGRLYAAWAAAGVPAVSVNEIEKVVPATAIAAEPIVSLCLYLCSEEPDIAGLVPKMPERPTRPSPVPVKGGKKTFAADTARIWGTGMRLGAALRKARNERSTREPKETQEDHPDRRGPAPHIRRAHWHTFWTGSMSGPRTPWLKWIPPIPVAFGEAEAMTAVIHRVSRQ
jgi:hypothetical protein